ncbi:MAG: putative Ig domain-containing protein [Acidobacteria bacterium]|nr:putative Ig domain-containing protein [Acidobacteriota bacterium]
MRSNIVKGICVFAGWLLGAASLLAQGGPSVTGVNPTSTNLGQAVTVQLAGSGFNTCTRVVFRGQELATSVGTVGSTQVASASLPSSLVGTAGTFPIGVIRYSIIVGTVSLCSSTGGVTSNTVPFTIVSPPPAITTEIFNTNMSVCTAFQQTITAASGIPPYTWSATGLPTGININPSTGQISGTPTTPGQFPATIRVTDTQPKSDQVSVTYNVSGNVLGISTQLLPQGTVGTAYNQTMQLQGVSGTPSWSILSGAVPGLTLSTSGVLSGTPTTAGTFQTLFQLSDACRTVTKTIPITITGGSSNLTITTTSLPAGTQGVSYSATVAATGGIGTLNWTATGLPSGLTMNAASGVISGTPTVSGSFSVGVQVSDSQSRTASQNYTLVINAGLTITTPSLNPATVGVAYSQQMAASGGIGTLAWSASGLPSGFSISSSGLISGTPTLAGTFPVTVQVVDGQRTASRTYTLQVTAGEGFTIATPSLNPATVGVAYSMPLAATGGIGTLSWSAGGLPTGMVINSATGVISGTASTAGSFTVNVQVSDSQQRTATRTYTLQVTSTSSLTIVTTSLVPARVGQSYEALLVSAGAVGTVVWSSLTGLPPGLTLNPSTGQITGVPTLVGDFPLSIRAQDSSGAVATRSLTLSVITALTITTESPLPNAQVGAAYNQQISANGGITPFRWLALNALPPGLSFDTVGILSGTPTQGGTFLFTIQVFDGANLSATKTFQLTVTANFSITTAGLPNGTVGVFYNQTLSTAGGRAPIRWGEQSGQLPLGLVLNSNTGGLTGTPQQAGDFTFTLFALDADQQRATKQFTVTIRGNFRITTDTLPGATVGEAYSQTIGTTGGTAPLTFTVSEGTLPAGLSLNRTSGAITGTPTAAGTFAFTVQANDSNNQSARQAYSIVIIGPPRIVTESLPAGRVGNAYTATVEAAGGETPYRFSATGLPNGLTINATTGAITGNPTQAGSFDITVTVTDRAGRTGTQQFTVSIAAVLTITTTTLPAGVVGTPYSSTLAASGGTGLQWRVSAGTLPAGLTLSQAGVISGTPTAAGNSSFTVEVRDSGGSTATRAFTITVANLTLSQVNVTLSLTTVGPTDQPAVRVQLANPAPTNLTGTLTLAFTGVADNKRDAQFSQRDTTFRIPQGQTNAVFAEGLAVQIGTVAGTINITAALNANGVNVTPNPAPTVSITVQRLAPVITSLTATRNGNTLTLVVDGYSTTREVTSADVQFAIRAGATVQGSTVTVQAGTAFTTYYGADSSNGLGGMFRLTLPFNVTGAAADITGASVTLVNTVGRSAARTANF